MLRIRFPNNAAIEGVHCAETHNGRYPTPRMYFEFRENQSPAIEAILMENGCECVNQYQEHRDCWTAPLPVVIEDAQR